ncbi:MAG: hypothetical protein KBE23_08760 [Chloroflexi bacterium]|nr:hypothetical protein [Chloroflexota bacterium]MBP7042823.1 hypothetical protein [Chloroflexota bacterium]
MLRSVRTTLNPAWYQGARRQRPYFEGWYFKLVDAATQQRYAIIPGLFKSGDPHAFIQVLNGQTGTAHYHRFAPEMFWAADNKFEIHIGGSRFAADGLTLDIDTSEQTVRGEVRLGDLQPWPVALTAPGIMGWYAWVPTMECYHGVVSLDHALSGSLVVDGTAVDFSGGRGYIEKDWGKSFPQAWVWLQSNHFEQSGVCLTGSIAIIPWQRTSFNGFIVGLWVDGRLYRFATYTGAKVAELAITDDAVQWVLRDKRHQLSILARRGATSLYGLLKGPTTLEMGKRVEETLTATVEVQLCEVGSGREVFAGNGRCAGLEVYNPAALLDTRI